MYSLRHFALGQSFCILLVFAASGGASADEDLAARQVALKNKPNGILTYDGNHFNQTGMDFVAEQMLAKFK